MILSKSELESYNLLKNVPETFKGDYPNFFVFYYEVDEETKNLKIFETEWSDKVNLVLYAKLPEKENMYQSNLKIGYFKDEFETKDELLRQFIATYNDEETLKAFYEDIERREEELLKVPEVPEVQEVQETKEKTSVVKSVVSFFKKLIGK